MPIKRKLSTTKSSPTLKGGPKTSDIAARIQPVAELKEPISIAVYGKQGTGKTTLFGSFPTPSLLLDINEKGTDSVSDVRGMDVLRIKSADDLEAAYFYLTENPKKYKSVALDAVSALQALVMAKVRQEEKKGENELLSKRMWGRISGWMNTWLLHYRDLTDLGMHVCFIAHDRVFGGDDEDGSDDAMTPSVGPRLMPSVASTLNGAVGVIGNTFIKEKVVRSNKDKKPRRIPTYSMRVGPHEYYITKIRSPKSREVPSVIENPTFDQVVNIVRGK